MAQPPNIPNPSDIFVREVDENLRRDQMRDFAKKYGKWVIVAVILFLIAAAGFIYWQQYRERQSEKQVEALANVYRDIGAGNLSTAPKRLQALADDGSKSVRASALFTLAAIDIEKNDTKAATDKFRQLATDKGVPQPYRDAALLRQTSLEFDHIKPEEVISRMQPLAKAGNPWFGSAGELTAAALIKQGKKAEAGQLYAAIAKDPKVPQLLRARAIQLASSLGVEAGVPTPAVAQ